MVNDKNILTKQAIKQSKRIPQLEGLRFVMCCIIILSHMEYLGNSKVCGVFYDKYLHNPTMAVDYFFLLSGLGIFLSSKRPQCSIKGAFQFATNKVKKYIQHTSVHLFWVQFLYYLLPIVLFVRC